MSPSLSLFILVVLFVVGWFALGTQYNVRKGHHVLRWLQDGLPLVGEKTTLRWLGSSVLELKMHEAKPPFRHAEIVVVFEPRDAAPVWAFSRWRGRRDLFIFRGVLRNRPSLQLEALDPKAWPAVGFSDRVKNWTPLSVPAPLQAYAPANAPAATELLTEATLDACPLQLFIIRKDEPNFELQWRLDPLRKHSARVVFETVQRLAARL
jgi:hypothetical protein